MRASNEHPMRSLDFTALADGEVKLQRAVLHFVRGINGPRTNGVPTREVCKYLRATPADSVKAALAVLVEGGRVRNKGGYYFVIEVPGETPMGWPVIGHVTEA